MQYKHANFLAAVSHQEHKIIKYVESTVTPKESAPNNTNKQSKINTELMCQKIITLAANDHQGKIRIQNQLQHIKDYIQRRHNCSSELQMPIRLESIFQHEQRSTIIKLNTKYNQNQTLSQHFRKRMFHEYQQFIEAPEQKIVQETIYMVEELFEIVVRAGGIDNFFYTPNNIFINPIKKEAENRFDFNKLEVNPFSMVGLKFLVERGNINREEFSEIFASLPPNFFNFLSPQQVFKLNILIKKRGMAFLILCCLLERVPDLINVKALDYSLSPEKVRKCLEESTNYFSSLIDLYKDLFQKLKQKVKIDFYTFFTRVFINNCADYTWEDIYHDLFQKNRINLKTLQTVGIKSPEQNSQPSQFEYPHKEEVKKYIDRLWKNEKNKRFYEQRELFLSNPKPNQLPTLYLIVKFNVNFHRTLRYVNMIQELRHSRYSSDQNEANNNFFKLVNEETQTNNSTLSTMEEDLNLIRSGMIYECSHTEGEKDLVLFSLDEKQKSLNQLMTAF